MTAISAPPPTNDFASDNSAGIHPVALDAIVRANSGTTLAYGLDPWTQEAQDELRQLLGAPEAVVRFVFGGTGGNVVALGSLLRPHHCVVCTEAAHIHVDECGAPERIAGTKLLASPTTDGRLTPQAVETLLWMRGDVHHPQPAAVCITQATESGTVYSLDEIGELARLAHDNDMVVVMDGARLANAASALGLPPATFVTDAGIDAVVVGGTKAGMAYGEAMVIVNPALADDAPFVQKGSAQLPSKQRFIAAQFTAMLASGAWLSGAENANAMAQRLAAGARDVPGVTITTDPQVNSVFARLPRRSAAALREWSPHWAWDVNDPGDGTELVRWMTSWATTDDDVDRFVAGLTEAMHSA